MEKLLRVLGRRDGQDVPVGFVGREGGPGYVTSPRYARRFSDPAAREFVEDLRDRLPGVRVEPVSIDAVNGFDSLP